MLKIPCGARSEAKNVKGSEVESDEEAGSMLKEVEEALPTLEQRRDEGDDDDMESGPEDLANGDDSEHDDMPEYELEEGEKQVTDPDYVFCPEVHCRQLLRKFSKHLCQHPFFPTSSGTYQTSSEIHRACVYDMYTFCCDCGLTEAWAYLWNSWYGCWNLWARSSCESRLSRIRTTMITENHWKRLKHGYLRFKIRSPLDQTVYIIAYSTIDSYIHSANILEPKWRLSRGRPLTPWQRAFKTAWVELTKRCVSGRNYGTDVVDWTCCWVLKMLIHFTYAST